MAISTERSDSFEELLESYLAGEIDSVGKKRLLEIILQDPEKAAEYRQLTLLQSRIRAAEVFSSFPSAGLPKGSNVIQFPNSFKYLSAIAAVLLLSISIYLFTAWNSNNPVSVFTQSYGDCTSDGKKLEAGENISGKSIRSGKYSVCDVQLDGEKSVTVRAMPETDFIADRKDKEIHLSLGYGSILVDSQGPKDSEKVFITADDFRLSLEGTKVALNRPNANSSVSVQVIEGRVHLESGSGVFWQSLTPWINPEEASLLAKEYPALFEKQEVLIESGEQIAWKGLSPERVEGLRRIENSIKASKKVQPGTKIDESLVKSLKPHVDSLPKEPFLISPKELKNSLRKILPDEKAELERKFATMVRFPPKDLRERELLMELVKKIDKTSIVDLLKEKNQSQEIRILILKDGGSEKGYIYQQDNFYIVLKRDGNLIVPVDAVDRIEFE
ncbi:iron dicitrate transport regulator FecR [Leptospira wolffii]|uniref:LIMLP_03685 family anti-sigma factor n=1 Tax=Leptospira wolffii TaxID=409998 RepID=UPI0010835055|nr:FecR domain-containing protein [Leptospira wolffii]TGL52680.1 iron dicitrate transport regulator FecR [Leptospira wolffii]